MIRNSVLSVRFESFGWDKIEAIPHCLIHRVVPSVGCGRPVNRLVYESIVDCCRQHSVDYSAVRRNGSKTGETARKTQTIYNGNPTEPKFFEACEPVTSSSTSQRASTAVPERRQASSNSSRTLFSTRQDDVRNVATLGTTRPGENNVCVFGRE